VTGARSRVPVFVSTSLRSRVPPRSDPWSASRDRHRSLRVPSASCRPQRFPTHNSVNRRPRRVASQLRGERDMKTPIKTPEFAPHRLSAVTPRPDSARAPELSRMPPAAPPPRLTGRTIAFGMREPPAPPARLAPRSLGARLPIAPPPGEPAEPGPIRHPAERAELPVGPWSPAPGFHGAVIEFKRRLIEATLTRQRGNRTRTARALGLQRTYLLRLMREFEVKIPPAPAPTRRDPSGQAPPPPRAG